MPATLRIIQGDEFRQVANALRQIDRRLPTQFRKELRDAVKPMVQDVKARARNLPARGNRSTGLRRRVARGVGVQAKVGRNPSVRIVTKMPTPEQAIIPRGLDSRSMQHLGGGWTHPTFGHQPVVFQKGYSWFVEPLGDYRNDIADALTGVLEEARDYVARHGGAI